MEAKNVVIRGAEPGVVLTPHKHDDGKYVASLTRFEDDYIRVETVRELKILADNGFSVRMSNPDTKNHRSPSLIIPSSIEWSA